MTSRTLVIASAVLACGLAVVFFARGIPGAGTAHAAQGGPDAPPARDDAIQLPPKRYGVDRYSRIWDKSPFAFEVIVEEETEDGPGPFDDITLSSFARFGGVYHVTLVDKKDPTNKIRLRSDRAVDGISVIDVQLGDRISDTIVVVESEDGERAELGFDDAKLTAAPTGAAGMANQQAQAQAQAQSRANVAAQQQQIAAQQQQIAAAQARAQAVQQQLAATGNAPDPNAAAAAGNPADLQAAAAAAAAAAQQPGVQAQAAAGEAATAADRRSEVIKQLLEKARANQSGDRGGGDDTDRRRRRVILPPAAGR